MNLPEIRFSEVADNEFCSPFDGRTLALLETDEEAREILHYFASLYDERPTSRSVPGYSLRRKIASELNRFGRFHQNENYDISIYSEPLNKVAEIAQCDKLLERLLYMASQHKVRTLNSHQLNLLAYPEYANGILFKSKILTANGMRFTIDTFTNFPQEIYHKIRFSK